MTTTFAVYVLDRPRVRPRWVMQFASARMATVLAQNLREIFGCSAWVCDYYQPADVINVGRRVLEAPHTPGQNPSAAR
jgi:hypothetical protein